MEFQKIKKANHFHHDNVICDNYGSIRPMLMNGTVVVVQLVNTELDINKYVPADDGLQKTS